MKHRSPSLAAAAILFAVAALLAGCGETGPVSGPAGTGETVAATPEDRFIDDFWLFRRRARARDGAPDGLVPEDLADRLGLDIGAAKLARARLFSRLYVVPGKRAVCMFDTGGVSSPCWPRSTVAKGLAVSTSFCSPGLPAGEMQMVGIVPDGVTEVWVERREGERARFPVRHNVFVADLATGGPLPTRVGWVRGGGRHVQSAGISARVARMDCA